MKNTGPLIILIFLILLSACSQRSAKDEEEPIQKKETAFGTAHKESDHPDTSAVEKQQEQKQQEEKQQVPAENAVKPSKAQYRLNPANWSFKPIGNANPKVALLTFDDAPDKYALDIAKSLKSLGVQAIFFVNGHFIATEQGKAKLKQIHDMGFWIGNHTYDHVSLKDLPGKQQYSEIVKLNDEIQAIIGQRPKFFRAPFGLNTDYTRKVAADEKMLLMNWTYGYDWEKDFQEKGALTKIMLETPYLVNGANLLLHDRSWTSEAIAGIVKGLKEKGYDILDPALIEVPK
ncbi:polysaccharide deacetylase family protein [Peribacillus sp. SCS-155]|uniref:polysaccharide deacetylase family protein n=1 Tax=Peribacillus sedimenti TaxID=3115297 RepID=UPI0039062354